MSNSQLFPKKSSDALVCDMEKDEGFKRTLGSVARTSLGVGTIIGTGVFVLARMAGADQAGPAIMLPLPSEIWLRLTQGLLLGLMIYFCYGYWQSKLRTT